jgi:hypothetical protein
MATARHKLAMLALHQGDLILARTSWIELISLAREWDQRDILLAGLEGIGRVWLQQREPLRAARLLGAAEAAREAMHPPLEFYEPPDQIPTGSFPSAPQATSGDQAVLDAWAAGRAMSLEEALACALEESNAN